MTVREERIGDCRLILGDCLDVMPTLGKVDAVVTSPPYDNLREYGPGFNGLDFFQCIELISDLLENGGVCMWNVADATVAGSETGSSFRQALHAIDCGLKLHDTMIYAKDGFSSPESNRYPSCFEYMFIFSKSSPKTFNPIKDRKNKGFGRVISSSFRYADGSTKPAHSNGNTIGEWGVRYNWWVVKNNHRDATNTHPAVMPYQMAHAHIESWSNPSETILDPFMGSGTTLVACAKLGRKGIGIEIDPDYFEIACKRVDEAYRQPDLFVEKPAPPTQDKMDL